MSDKEFALTFELRQLQQDRNRLERIKERTDNDLDETRQRIRALKKQLEKTAKPAEKKKAAALKKSRIKRPVAPRVAEAEKEGEKISEVKVDADSMKAIEDSVELEEKKPVEKKTKTKESEKTDPA